MSWEISLEAVVNVFVAISSTTGAWTIAKWYADENYGLWVLFFMGVGFAVLVEANLIASFVQGPPTWWKLAVAFAPACYLTLAWCWALRSERLHKKLAETKILNMPPSSWHRRLMVSASFIPLTPLVVLAAFQYLPAQSLLILWSVDDESTFTNYLDQSFEAMGRRHRVDVRQLRVTIQSADQATEVLTAENADLVVYGKVTEDDAAIRMRDRSGHLVSELKESGRPRELARQGVLAVELTIALLHFQDCRVTQGMRAVHEMLRYSKKQDSGFARDLALHFAVTSYHKARPCGDNQKITGLFEQRVKTEVDNAPLWVALGELRQLESFDTARNAFGRAREIDAGFGSPHRGLGVIAAQTGDPCQALADLEVYETWVVNLGQELDDQTATNLSESRSRCNSTSTNSDRGG